MASADRGAIVQELKANNNNVQQTVQAMAAQLPAAAPAGGAAGASGRATASDAAPLQAGAPKSDVARFPPITRKPYDPAEIAQRVGAPVKYKQQYQPQHPQ